MAEFASTSEMLGLPAPGVYPVDETRWQVHIWSPGARLVCIKLFADTSSEPREIALSSLSDAPDNPLSYGHFFTEINGLQTGQGYQFVVDDLPTPDPASRWQPHGVHGHSNIFDPRDYAWGDRDWSGIALADCIIYELHIGTFTPAGTFESAIAAIPHLLELGITAVEIMPVAQFPGDRNWGYDGTFPYAVQHSYGGPLGLQRFVDACHQAGLAVFLDVVYNHLGHEGNYLWDRAPYFSQTHFTPWGPSINADGPHSEPVRHYFIENALYWLREFHLDGLRLDAIDCVIDAGANPFVRELSERVASLSQQLDRPLHLIGETALNDPRFVLERDRAGYGLSGQWAFDFQFALHALLTGERETYYIDFGSAQQLQQAFEHPFVFCGHYSHYYQRRRGTPEPPPLPPDRFVVYSQNHDQVGNRPQGDRLSTLVEPHLVRLAAGLVLLSPYVPLLFMGEEYGEVAPFYFFTEFSDQTVIEGMRRGRERETGERDSVIDPQDAAWFAASKLNLSLKHETGHQTLFQFYRRLVELRRRIITSATEYEVLADLGESDRVFAIRYTSLESESIVLFCLPGEEETTLPQKLSNDLEWTCLLNSNAEEFGCERKQTFDQDARFSGSIFTANGICPRRKLEITVL
ncbi:MAG: malto-oligosyltrehalose trehalohydrolase, partial [Cyanobacteria bacterium J06642_2]